MDEACNLEYLDLRNQKADEKIMVQIVYAENFQDSLEKQNVEQEIKLVKA